MNVKSLHQDCTMSPHFSLIDLNVIVHVNKMKTNVWINVIINSLQFITEFKLFQVNNVSIKLIIQWIQCLLKCLDPLFIKVRSLNMSISGLT